MLSRFMVGAVLALTAMAGALAAPAQASPASSAGVAAPRYLNLGPADPCPGGYFCAFEGTYAEGSAVGFYATEANWGAIPAEFRWINNRARSGTNNGTTGGLDDVWAYPLPNFVNHASYPAVCTFNKTVRLDWGALRPESNKWFTSCADGP